MIFLSPVNPTPINPTPINPNPTPKVRAFDPEMIFLSAGFDAHKDDPLSSARLEHADFAWLTREVAAISPYPWP